MPEGHTIHRAARRLQGALAGQRLHGVAARGQHLVEAGTERRLRGTSVAAVQALGKHLLIHVDAGWSVHSHLRMDGAWHLYRTGERWRRSPGHAWLVLDTGAWQAVNFNGPILELHRTEDILRDRRLLGLGPDILVEPFDERAYLRRLRQAPARQVGEALMHQRTVAGIGNIYKSESLFLAGISPWRSLADVGDDELSRVRDVATRIMRDGVLDARAITFQGPGPPGRWVYMRSGQPCRRCGARIRSADQGGDQRTTYWCPRCQP